MNKYQIHVDTASASNVQTYTGQVGQAQVTKVNGNPFQATIILGNRHRAIRTAALKDAQIPIGFYNVRAPYNTVTLNGTTYTVPPGNYTATSLISALNAQITNSVGVFGTSSTTNQVQFVSNSGTVTFTVLPLTLGAFLGFTNLQSGTSVTATYSYIVNFDTYFSIWIQNLGTTSLDGQQITTRCQIPWALEE
jgi:dihydroxyacetone kinase-like predicted kinase